MAALKEIIKQLIREVEQMVDNGECDLNPERVDETTAPYVIYGTVAKVEVQCAIVG